MSHKYLSDIILSTARRYASRNANNIPLARINNSYFMNTFFPCTITAGKIADLSIFNTTSLNTFKDILLQFVRPIESRVYSCHNPTRIKQLTRLRIGFSHLDTLQAKRFDEPIF